MSHRRSCTCSTVCHPQSTWRKSGRSYIPCTQPRVHVPHRPLRPIHLSDVLVSRRNTDSSSEVTSSRPCRFAQILPVREGVALSRTGEFVLTSLACQKTRTGTQAAWALFHHRWGHPLPSTLVVHPGRHSNLSDPVAFARDSVSFGTPGTSCGTWDKPQGNLSNNDSCFHIRCTSLSSMSSGSKSDALSDRTPNQVETDT